MRKTFASGLILFLLVLNVSGEEIPPNITGACLLFEFPGFFDLDFIDSNSVKCIDNLTWQECSNKQGEGGIISVRWMPVTTCSGAVENMSGGEGICVATNGSQAGICGETTPDLCNTSNIYYTEGEMIYLENTTCMDLTGACTFTEVEGILINETICTSSHLGVDAFWLQDRCCIQGDLSVNEFSCKHRLNGIFQGRGSTCQQTTTTTTTQPPIPAPEYPTPLAPALAILLATTTATLILARKH
ncbi:MAG: hypothetical protein U9M95_06115 [Candidatus Altiarchaeota archaeon]|nr:hypothetical protein [Candidatus Altiarchaeota archaeon]